MLMRRSVNLILNVLCGRSDKSLKISRWNRFLLKKSSASLFYGAPFLRVMSIMFVVWPQSHETRVNWLEWQESNGKVSRRKRNMIQMKNSCSCGVLQRDIYKMFLKKEEQGSSRQRKIIEIRLWLQMSPPCPLQVNWLRRKETTFSMMMERQNSGFPQQRTLQG